MNLKSFQTGFWWIDFWNDDVVKIDNESRKVEAPSVAFRGVDCRVNYQLVFIFQIASNARIVPFL